MQNNVLLFALLLAVLQQQNPSASQADIIAQVKQLTSVAESAVQGN